MPSIKLYLSLLPYVPAKINYPYTKTRKICFEEHHILRASVFSTESKSYLKVRGIYAGMSFKVMVGIISSPFSLQLYT